MIFLSLLFCFAGPHSGVAQESRAVAEGEASDSTHHPNQTPYTTDRSIAYHLLATPAYLLHAATRPIGWGVKFVERRYPGLFDVELPPRGVLPLVELGGPTGFMGGLFAYDNHLFGSDHEARVEGLFGSQDAFEVRARYTHPRPWGQGTEARLAVNVFSDPRSEFYLDGNTAARPLDETEFIRQQIDVTAGTRWSRGPVTTHVDMLYEHVAADRADTDLGDRLGMAAPDGLQSIDLLTPRVSVLVERMQGQPRAHIGTGLLLQVDYSHDLNGDGFRYGRYVAELRQHLPVGIFPQSRRLVLRGRLEQVRPLFGGTSVPFYQLPGLGGQSTLRGFGHRRFQERGSLVVNAEYRYPIWSNLDAVVFADAGQVFPDLQTVALDQFHWSYGGGIHLLNQRGLSFRFEVAGSVEGVRTILTVDPTVRRLTR
jgi:outer membrane protein assembly factor BamA